MDILYILGDGSKWGDNELRYSLRSIDTFGRNVGEVFLCGTHKPDFLGDNVRFFKVEQTLDPSRNIQQAIQAAIDHFGLGEFLLSSDDHFYTKPTDFNNYPYYLKGELPSALSEGVYGDLRYTRTLVNTYNLLKKEGLPTRHYAHHANAHISARIWRKCAGIWAEALKIEGGVEPTCVVLNALAAESDIGAVKRRDIKIRSSSEIVRALKSECFSVYDSAIDDGIGGWLRMAFPNASRWERRK